jgi:cell division protein FtsL
VSVPNPSRLTAPRPRPQTAGQHLKLVEGRRRRGFTVHTPGARSLAAVAAAVLVVFGVVALHAELAQRQFAIDRLDQQLAQQQTRYQLQRLQVAQLGAPSRIISMAEGTLGMRAPTSVTYLAPTSRPATVPRRGPATARRRTSPTAALPAPAGDADWPQIKSLLAGAP